MNSIVYKDYSIGIVSKAMEIAFHPLDMGTHADAYCPPSLAPKGEL